MRLHLLPDRLADILETIYWGCLKISFQLCREETVVSPQRSSSALWGRCLPVAECDICQKVDQISRPYCVACMVTRCNSRKMFLWRHLKEQIYAVRDLVARLQAAVTMVDTSMLRNGEALLSAFKWTEPTSNTNCNYNVQWFDCLTACST
jgi:hypothetical protein